MAQPGKRVIIVDDSKFLRRELRKILERHQFEVVDEGENGEQGVELYKKHKPDLVTMDIVMPVMNGIESLAKIREFDAAARIVMVSSFGTRDNVMKAVKLGAKNFILKPFEEDKVMDIINRVLAQDAQGAG